MFDHVHLLLIMNHITLSDQKRRKHAYVLIFVQVLQFGGGAKRNPPAVILHSVFAQARVIIFLFLTIMFHELSLYSFIICIVVLSHLFLICHILKELFIGFHDFPLFLMMFRDS